MRKRVIAIVRSVIEDQGLEIVQLKNHPATKIMVWVDKPPEGVSVKDCATANRAIRRAMEEDGFDPGDYDIEIQSPGVDRPLVRAADYERFSGHPIKLRLKEATPLGRRNFAGKLTGLAEGKVTLVGDEEWTFHLSEVDECRLDPKLPEVKERVAKKQAKGKRSRKPRKSRRKRPKEH